jgi:serine/threonine-protein kinase HipA
MRQLAVYSNDTFAGTLTEVERGGKCRFEYDAAYLASSLQPVSLTLPKRREPYEAEYLFPFFTALLPEGANRRYICRTKHIDEKDLFGLLDAMAGADFIGAVNVRKK